MAVEEEVNRFQSQLIEVITIAFYKACKSGDDSDQNHLAAARALVGLYDSEHDWGKDEDPEATRALLAEVRKLCNDLTIAVNLAEGHGV